jgi:hypothetical protein
MRVAEDRARWREIGEVMSSSGPLMMMMMMMIQKYCFVGLQRNPVNPPIHYLRICLIPRMRVAYLLKRARDACAVHFFVKDIFNKYLLVKNIYLLHAFYCVSILEYIS